jgi:hypothetical protein
MRFKLINGTKLITYISSTSRWWQRRVNIFDQSDSDASSPENMFDARTTLAFPDHGEANRPMCHNTIAHQVSWSLVILNVTPVFCHGLKLRELEPERRVAFASLHTTTWLSSGDILACMTELVQSRR